jgi:hypothetical protein
MSLDNIKAWVTRKLGYPQVAVELHPCHLEDAIEDAKDWYLANKGLTTSVLLELQQGLSVYPYPDGAQAIIDVIPPGTSPTSLWGIGVSEGTGYYPDGRYGAMGFPYGASAASYSGGGPISGIVQSDQYIEEAQRVLSADFDWWVDEGARTIHVSPIPRSGGPLGVVFTTRAFSTDQLNPLDYDLFKKYTLALAKEVLAQIRGKYSRVPGADGEQTLNADKLAEEASAAMEKLTEELKGSAMPALFVVG